MTYLEAIAKAFLFLVAGIVAVGLGAYVTHLWIRATNVPNWTRRTTPGWWWRLLFTYLVAQYWMLLLVELGQQVLWAVMTL